MTSTQFVTERNPQNPLDIVEQLISSRDWLFDRPAREELVAEVEGGWCHYRIWFSWQADLGAVMFSCAYETRVPEHQRAKVYPLLARINERLLLGHFDIGEADGLIMFRHALLVRGGQGASPEQLEDLIDIATSECTRFYPAFQSVIWGGNTIDDAIAIAMLDTVGEA
jgi:hypothetical protein